MVKKTPHCYRSGRNTPQGVERVGGSGIAALKGLMAGDSDCGFCTNTDGRHSRSCPLSCKPSKEAK